MAHIPGSDRAQMLLLPEAIDDYVGADNPVRFVDAFVDGLDLAAAGFGRVSPSVRGRPGYDPADLLKLYIYGYLNRVRSSRRLEVEARRNIEVIWLMRRLTPDFKTIADFRRENRSAIRQVFREFTLLCRELDLFGRELIAVDGTRIKAVNNKDRNFTRTSLQRFIAGADACLEDYLQRLENGDAAEAALPGSQTDENLSQKIAAIRARRDRREALLDELERTGESQISLTDPDSRAMAGHTKVAVGYNIQCAVDAKYKLIVDQQVTNHVVDMGLLVQAAEPVLDILGVARIDVVADSGYFRAEDIEECGAKGLIPHVPRPRRGSSISNGRFGREMFRYDPEHDVYHCPGGAELHPIGPNVETFVDVVMRRRQHPEQGYRSCLGVLRLAKAFGRDRLDAACSRALEINARSYSSLHSILKNGLDRTPRTRATDEPAITPPNIRGADYFH